MIISDLNHLEVVTESSSVVGGTTYKPSYNKLRFNLTVVKNDQKNVSVINQEQNVKAVAIAGKFGEATAVAVGGDQTAVVKQINAAAANL